MKTIHVIFNAHLDPIWLWPWQAGLDEALATCRSACDRLDAHPDLIFSRNEAWIYKQVEETDPELFERIRSHVKTGQWEIVGGWWIQPDCNAPSGFGFERQIELGKQYFLSRFGFFPRCAYNVDSFGHAASLPGYLRSAGQDRYVMMRPQEHEKALPARIFRWRGVEDGPEVTVFRIASAYTCGRPNMDHLKACVTELPEGSQNTMLFLGVGDHGGGPTEELITWVKENTNAVEGWNLEFSSVNRFFDAIEAQREQLPQVVGELQMHAVGCYSVYRPIKTALRKAEHLLRQAEALFPPDTADRESYTLWHGWEKVCLHQFHDTLGGTCIPSAYPQALDQLASASAAADEILQRGLRRQMVAMPPDPHQRIVLQNASDVPFNDWVEYEPWMGGRGWSPGHRLINDQGECIPYQILPCEAQAGGPTRLLFKVSADPGALKVIRIIPDDNRSVPPPGVEVIDRAIRSNSGTLVEENRLLFPEGSLPMPRLDLIEDLSDTWSHGVSHYGDRPLASARWEEPFGFSSGPLMASFWQRGLVGGSQILAEWRVYDGDPFAEMRLRIHWRETQKLLKLVLPFQDHCPHRLDGIPGMAIVRENDGAERPLRDWMLMLNEHRPAVSVICPEVYALDARPDRIRLTLLRSSWMAHHEPFTDIQPGAVASDQGVHEFCFRFCLASNQNSAQIDRQAIGLQRPLVMGTLTHGMGWER